MADIASQLIQIGSETAKQTGAGLGAASENFMKASELALRKEQNQMAQMKLRQDAEAAQLAKYEKLGNAFDIGAKMPEGKNKNAYMKSYIPNLIQALGMNGQIDPTVLEMYQNDPTLVTYMRSKVMDGTFSVEQILKDPQLVASSLPDALRNNSAEQIVQSVTDNPEAFVKATSERQSNLARESEARATASRFAKGQTAQEERDRKASLQEVAKERSKLGLPGLTTSLKEVDTLLEGGLDGFKGKQVPGMTGADGKLPDNRLSPAGKKMRGAVRGVANQLLKLRNGGAISDGEAGRLLSEIGVDQNFLETGIFKFLASGTTTADSFINGMRRARATVAAQEQDLANAYGVDVYSQVAGRNTVRNTQTPTQTPVSGDTEKPPIINLIETNINALKASLAGKTPQQQANINRIISGWQRKLDQQNKAGK